MSPYMVTYSKKLRKIGRKFGNKHDVFNTEITYSIANRVISIVEHRPE